MTRKSFSGSAVPTTLDSGITSTAMSFGVGAVTNWPDTAVGPFVITVDRGQGTLEEKILISSYSGTTLTVETRGFDGTTGQAHSMGAAVVCTLDADTINTHDAFVAAVGTVTPTTSAVGDSAVDGSSGKPADALHKHARESFATGATTASAPADTENDGSSASSARADHKHARESVATLVSDLTPGLLGKPLALTGAVAATRFVGGTTSGAPTTGTFAVGDFVIDQTGLVWICTALGTPGTWGSAPVDSGAWTSFTPSWAASGSAPAIGNGVLVGFYKKLNRTVHVRISITSGSTTNYGSGTYVLGLPVESASSGSQALHGFFNDETNVWAAAGTIAASATTFLPYTLDGNVGAALHLFGATQFSVSGQVLVYEGTYESLS